MKIYTKVLRAYIAIYYLYQQSELKEKKKRKEKKEKGGCWVENLKSLLDGANWT